MASSCLLLEVGLCMVYKHSPTHLKHTFNLLDSMASSCLLLAVGLCMVYKHKSDSSQPHIQQGKYSRQMSSICHNLVKHIPANQLHASIGLIRQIYKCHTFTFLISTNMWTCSRNKTIRRSHKVCNITELTWHSMSRYATAEKRPASSIWCLTAVVSAPAAAPWRQNNTLQDDGLSAGLNVSTQQ